MVRRLGWMVLLAGVFSWAAGCGSSDEAPKVEANINTVAAVADEPQAEPEPEPPVQYDPRIVIQTTLGEITVKLDAEKAPITVNNFLAYVEAGHYDQTIFHQAVEGYIVLAGGYSADLREKPVDVAIRNEAGNGLANRRGTIAMARQFDVIDSSTSQFFINLADNPALDHAGEAAEEYGYCVFGEVTDGLELLDKIGQLPVRNVEGFEMIPVEPVIVLSIKRIE